MGQAFEIVFSELFDVLLTEHPRMTPRYKELLLDAIGDQLRHGAKTPTRHRKRIELRERPPWKVTEPIWQLTIVPWRVFYAILDRHVVQVLALGWKDDRRTTQEMVDEIGRIAQDEGLAE